MHNCTRRRIYDIDLQKNFQLRLKFEFEIMFANTKKYFVHILHEPLSKLIAEACRLNFRCAEAFYAPVTGNLRFFAKTK